MSDLLAFQTYFSAQLLAPVPGRPAALAVHRNSSAQAGIDALAGNFPVCRLLLGADAFEAAAATFFRRHPPGDPRLSRYGTGFPAFLAEWPAFADLPYLADVAQIELLVNRAEAAHDAPPLDPARLAAGLDSGLRLALHPAARLLRTGMPAASIWLAHQPGASPDAWDAMHWGPEDVLVTRPHLMVEVRAIHPAAADFLATCALGLPVIAAAQASLPHTETAFASLLLAGAFLDLEDA